MRKLLIRSLAVGFVFAIPVPANAQEDAKAIIRQAIEAEGGADALNKYPAGRTQVKGTLHVRGAELPFTGESAYQIPGRARNVIRIEAPNQKVTVTQVVNGAKVRMTANGKPVPASDALRDELRQAVEIQRVLQLTPLLSDPGYELKKIDKPERVRGRETVGVAVKGKNLKEVKLFFDKKTHLLAKVERRGLDPNEQEALEEQFFSDYKKVGGIMRPGRFEVSHDGKKHIEAEFTDYQNLPKIDPKEFDVEG